MATSHSQFRVSLDELHLALCHDPYYGFEPALLRKINYSEFGPIIPSHTDDKDAPTPNKSIPIIESLYRDHESNVIFAGFQRQFSVKPCKANHQLHLLLLWCGPMGLPSHQNNELMRCQPMDYLENWTQEFEIQLDDLKDFLRENNLPLPVAYFPTYADNTKNKTTVDATKFQQYAVELPQLENRLAELKQIQPENMTEDAAKQDAVSKIEKQIQLIIAPEKEGSTETPEEREQRLKRWFAEETQKKPNGALRRTAEKEGITRQTLSEILKR
ncbi:MAG: hypothetical protein KUG82_23025 [Pseudomonadales bacterium]|nr:hypothetical protein [Pseudomonadales bacterium]